MNRLALLMTFALAALAAPAHAQFGWSVTFDPTQAAHALSQLAKAEQQIAKAEQTYTTAVKTTENVIGVYNLAQRMASSPQSLYTSFSSGLPSWLPAVSSTDTYGNTGQWMGTINKYAGQATTAIQGASIPRVIKLTGYEKLNSQGQQTVAAQTATLDLGDAVSATNLQTIGAVRGNQTARQIEITTLESASHSLAPEQQTELATLQRINQALLLMLRTGQDQSQLTQGQTMQQIVAAKQQQDELKMLFQAAQGYEANYQTHMAPSATGVKEVLSY